HPGALWPARCREADAKARHRYSCPRPALMPVQNRAPPPSPDREPFHASPNAFSLCLCLNALQRLSHIRLCIRKGGGAATIFHGSRHTTITSSFPVARRPRSGRVEVVHGPFVSYTHS